MRLIPRSVKAPTFTPGKRETVELRMDRVVHHWVLILAFDWAVTGGTGIGTFFADAQARLFKEWVLNGNDGKIVNMGGGALYLYTLLFLKEMYEQTLPSSLVAAASQTDRELYIHLPAAMGHALPGQEERFGFPAVANPSMEVLFGEADDLVSGEDGAVAISNLTSRMIEWAYDNAQTPVEIRGGRPVTVGWSPFMARTQSQAVNGDEELVFKLDELGLGYELRAIIIEAQKDGQAGGVDYVYDNSVVSQILEFQVNGEEKYKPINFRELQQENKRDYSLAAVQPGCAVIDAAADQNIARGELWTHGDRDSVPYLKLAVSKQGADLNRVRVTTIFTARR